MYGILEPLRGGDDIPLRKRELIIGRSDKCDVVLRFRTFLLSTADWCCLMAIGMRSTWEVLTVRPSAVYVRKICVSTRMEQSHLQSTSSL